MHKFALILPLIAGTLVAQSTTVVVPAAFTTTEAGSYHWSVGQYQTGRTQQVFAKSSMPTTPMLIKSFKMRRDGLRATVALHKAEMEVFFSNKDNDPPVGYNMDWANNRGNDHTLVMKKKTITWPAAVAPVTPPANFDVHFLLDQPFPYKGKAFMIEFTSAPNTNYTTSWYSYVTDAELYPWSHQGMGTRRTIGTACPATFNNYIEEEPWPGSSLIHRGDCQITGKQVPCFMFLGSTDKAYGALPLPFDMTGIGAPGCSLYVNIVQVFSAMSNASHSGGRVIFNLGTMPDVSGLTGMKYYCQIFALDPSYNALGMGASWGREYTIGTPFAKGTGLLPGLVFYSYTDSWRQYKPTDTAAWYYSARANIVELTY